MVFARDLEDGRERLRVGIDAVPYPVGDLQAATLSESPVRLDETTKGVGGDMADMLVDQNYPNVLPLGREPLERGFDGGVVCLGVDYKEVLLVVWRCCDMLWVACVSREW